MNISMLNHVKITKLFLKKNISCHKVSKAFPAKKEAEIHVICHRNFFLYEGEFFRKS
jgi:hypothetical protein